MLVNQNLVPMESMEMHLLTPSEAYHRMQEIQERIDYRMATYDEMNEMVLLQQILEDEIPEGAFIS